MVPNRALAIAKRQPRYVIYGVSSPKVNIDKKGNQRKTLAASALEAVLKSKRISRQEELRALKTDARTTNHGRKPRKTSVSYVNLKIPKGKSTQFWELQKSVKF